MELQQKPSSSRAQLYKSGCAASDSALSALASRKCFLSKAEELDVDYGDLSDPETEDGDVCKGELVCYAHLSRLLGDEVDGHVDTTASAQHDTLKVHCDNRTGYCGGRRQGALLAKRAVRAGVHRGAGTAAARLLHEARLLTQVLGGGAVSPPGTQPRILCVARRHCRKNKYVDIVGEYHLDLVQNFGGVPVILPRTDGTWRSLAEYLPMDGLLVAEGNDISDEVLAKYKCAIPDRLDAEGAAMYASDTEFDVSKDELEFALMHFALAVGCPILSMCRGSQMLNVLRGGSLIGDIGTEVGHDVVHLRDGSDPAYDSFRHPISVRPDTPLATWFADSLAAAGSNELLVNSYHHQGVKELGSGLAEMARAPDGVLEGFYDPTYDPAKGRFVVGLQFHPERMLEDYPGCARVYESFLEACGSFKGSQDLVALQKHG